MWLRIKYNAVSARGLRKSFLNELRMTTALQGEEELDPISAPIRLANVIK